MRRKFLFAVVFLIVAAAVAALPENARAQGPLLTGCTVNSSNVPSCSTPTGWQLAAAQGFDDGPVPSGQAIVSGSSIKCTFGHTGSCSLWQDITYNNAAVQWFYDENQLVGREYYLSFWDYGNGVLFNEEYLLNHMIKHGLGGATGYEEAAVTIFANGSACSASGGTEFNCPNAQSVNGTQGNYVHQNSADYGPTVMGYGSTFWNQWEIWEKANTPNNSDGWLRVYRNGTLFWDRENISEFGPVDMTGMQVEAGGWYTKNVWTNNGDAPNAGGTCSAAAGLGKEDGAGWVGGFGGSLNAANCAPAPPSFNRYIDDIILLERPSSGGSVSLSPAGLSFGTVAQGAASAGKTATLTNSSGSTITFTGTTFTGANGSDFSASANTCTGTLANGHTCAVTVVFTPSAAPGTNESGTLSVAFTGASGSPVTDTLTGTSGGAPSLSPTSLAFGTVTQGTSSSGLTTTLTNSSGSTITFTSTAFTGANASDFAASANTCTGTLATGHTCAITAVFTPSAAPGTNETATFKVNYTGFTGSPVTAALTGTSSGPPTVSPTSFSFGTVTQGTTSAGQTTTLTNNSGSTITITNYTNTGANGVDFAQTNTCGAGLTNGSSCTITEKFTPSAVPGTNESATLNVSFTGASGSPVTVSLAGTSGGPATISPTSLSFGTVTQGTSSSGLTTTVTNSSGSAITFTGTTFTGTNGSDFAALANTCAGTLVNGNTCTVTVVFTPTATPVANETATLNVAYTGASGSPLTASLAGTSGSSSAPAPPTSLHLTVQ